MSNANQSLALMLATITPREVLIEQLEESISEFKEAKLLNKSEEEMDDLFRSLAVRAHLITINVMTKGSLEGVQHIMQRMDELERQDNFFKKSTN
jgi:hypothetical protein